MKLPIHLAVKASFLLALAAFYMLTASGAIIPAADARQKKSKNFPQEQTLNVPGSDGSCAPYDTSWHHLSSCLQKVEDNWDQTKDADRSREAAVAREIAERVLLDDSTRFSADDERISQKSTLIQYLDRGQLIPDAADVHIFQSNDLGQPYNAMGQTDMTRAFLQMSARALDAGGSSKDSLFYRNAAEAMLRTVTDQTSEGGLATIEPCRADTTLDCAWFHSITRRNRPSNQGATLNQNLHALRDFGLIGDFYTGRGWPQPQPLDRLIAEGLNQLFLEAPRQRKGDLPTLEDFLAPPAGSSGVRWMYYGFNRNKPVGRGGYFLGRNGKDCGYQVHVLQLLSRILERAKSKGIWPVERALVCDGPLARAYRDTALRMSTDDPRIWSSNKLPKDSSCNAKHRQTFKTISSYYETALATCH
jgi:hypothetical protein